MSDFQKELILLALCLSFFFGFFGLVETVRTDEAAILNRTATASQTMQKGVVVHENDHFGNYGSHE